MRRAARTSWWAALAGAIAGLVVQTAWYAVHAGVDVRFVEDHPLPREVASGFDAPTTNRGVHGSWIGTRGGLHLRGVDRRAGWRIEGLSLAPPGRTVSLDADGRSLAEVRGAERPVAVAAVAAAQPDRSGLNVSLFVRDAASARDVFVERVTIVPLGWVRPPVAVAVSASVLGAAAGVAAWLLGGTWLAGLAAAVLLTTFQSLALTRGIAAFTPLPGLLTSVDLELAVVVSIWWAGWRVLAGSPPSRAACALAVISAAAFHLKLLVLLHPGVTAGDTIFHVHRLKDVLNGNYYLMSTAPGGSFPYPVGFYVLAARFADTPGENVAWLLRALACGADVIAGLLLAAIALRHWGGTRAIVFLLLFHLVPQNLSVQGRAFLANSFGNSCAVAALAVSVAAVSGRQWLSVVAAVLATLAMTSHLSSAIILAGVLAVATAGALAVRARREALLLAAIAACASGLAWGSYYRHFPALYERSGGQARVEPAPTETAAPEMREEAHQTRWVPGRAALAARAGAVPGYLLRYFGWAALILCAAGIWHLAASWRTDVLSRMTVSWLAACAAFLVLGVLTPADLRYYLAAFPAVALAAARSLDQGRWRTAVWVLIAIAIASGAWGWAGWLDVHDL